MACENGGKPKDVRECGIGNLDRRGDVIAVAAAVMVWIPFVTIGGHLISVAGRMARGKFIHTCLMR